MATRTDLLVIGAGPYAYSVAAFARDNGIATHVVGYPMAFWRWQMPADMYLRSGTDWHLDGSGEHTFEAYFEDRGLRREDFDPIPIAVFLDYTELVQPAQGGRRRRAAGHRVGQWGRSLRRDVGRRHVDQGREGAGRARHPVLRQPPGLVRQVPPQRRAHTSDIVSFDDLAGARVAIIGGRQSAYEWAALLCDHGAERVDVVHRHATPDFAKVSWAFVDAYIDQTLAQRGWWRHLSEPQRREITGNFWRVGRLTLEPWLVPRIAPQVVTSHPSTEVTHVAVASNDVTLTLSNGSAVTADYVVFASGYRADVARVPYLAGVLDQVSVTDGFPDLSEAFETSLPGLYITGFAATRDFGPFYGFTKGCPSAARIAVAEMMS